MVSSVGGHRPSSVPITLDHTTSEEQIKLIDFIREELKCYGVMDEKINQFINAVNLYNNEANSPITEEDIVDLKKWFNSEVIYISENKWVDCVAGRRRAVVYTEIGDTYDGLSCLYREASYNEKASNPDERYKLLPHAHMIKPQGSARIFREEPPSCINNFEILNAILTCFIRKEMSLSFSDLPYKVSSLPELLGHCGHLTHLDLSHQELKYVPSSIKKLPNLEKLDLSNNRLISLSDKDIEGNITHMGVLVESRGLTNVRGMSGELTNVGMFGNLINLRELNLSNCCLVSLPDDIAKLSGLELNLSWNNLLFRPTYLSDEKMIELFKGVTSLTFSKQDDKDLKEVFPDEVMAKVCIK